MGALMLLVVIIQQTLPNNININEDAARFTNRLATLNKGQMAALLGMFAISGSSH
jgi:hypothetical protein